MVVKRYGTSGVNTTLTSGGRWPTGTDYARAIQHSQTAFGDEALKQSTAATNAMGMPMVASGQNAVVFLMRGSGQDQAIRCFTTPPADGSSRYTALSSHLTATSPTAITESRWLDDGIRVDDNAWPVVVMPWVEGRPLNLVVEDAVGDSDGLYAMAEAWVRMVVELQAADVTHGDLQHGNVLVKGDGTYCLVDLDGSWVPTMAVGAPAESGHPNYQHPRRSAAQWARNGDSFSALLVETGMRALAADKSLERFLTGENILFNRADLLDTRRQVWDAIASSPDPDVVRLVTILKQRAQDRADASMVPFADLRTGAAAATTLPTVNDDVSGTIRRPLTKVVSSASGDGGDWWQQDASATAASSTLGVPAASAASSSELITSAPSSLAGASNAKATSTKSVVVPSPVRRSFGAVIGRDAAISGAIGGALAATIGCTLAGLITRDTPVEAQPVIFVSLVSLMLGGFLVSWQAFAQGARVAGFRRLAVGGLLGGVAGLLALLPATAIYGAVDTLSQVTLPGEYPAFEMPAVLSGAVWAVVAALVGLLIGLLRGARAGAAAAVSGAVAGFLGGSIFGANVAKFQGHQLLVNGLDPSTVLIVAAIGLVVGYAIGLSGKTLSKARLIIIEGRSKGMEILLPAKRATVGSASSNTLVLGADSSVGERHLEIDMRGTRPVAVVARWCNPIRVNGTETMRAELNDGDVLTIGESFVRFEWKGVNA